MGARLEWALLNYFIDAHVADGYEFILPPHMLEYQCGETAGQFPKFADEVYKIANPTDDRVHYAPTAEAAWPAYTGVRFCRRLSCQESSFAYTPASAGKWQPPGGRTGHGTGPPVQQGGNVSVHRPGTLTRLLKSWWARQSGWCGTWASISAR